MREVVQPSNLPKKDLLKTPQKDLWVVASATIVFAVLAACNFGPASTPALPSNTRTPRPTFTPRLSETEIPQANFTVVPPTDTIAATETKHPTKRASQTAIRTIATKQFSPSPIPATLIPTEDSYQYRFNLDRLFTAPNCGTVYYRGIVIDQLSNPINGVDVRLKFYDNIVDQISGRNEDPGVWSFAPYNPNLYHNYPAAEIYPIADPKVATPLAQPLEIPSNDCDKVGQITGIEIQRK